MKDEYDLRGAKRGAVVPPPENRTRINFWIDNDVLDFFRAQVNAVEGGDWQEGINAALRRYATNERMLSKSLPEPESLEETMRRVLREELHPVGELTK